MLNQDIPKKYLQSLRLLVLDSDGVCIPRGTEIRESYQSGLYSLNFKTRVISESLAGKVNRLKKRINVAFASGRGLLYIQSIYSPLIDSKTILIAENGAVLFRNNKIEHYPFNDDYIDLLREIRNEVNGLPVYGFEPKHFILTVHSPREFQEVYEIVRKKDHNHNLRIMWNGEAFDIQSKDISKGAALERLIRELGLEKEQVIAIGDRINDKEMLDIAGIGVSADKEALPAEYWTVSDKLPGEALVDYLLENLL